MNGKRDGPCITEVPVYTECRNGGSRFHARVDSGGVIPEETGGISFSFDSTVEGTKRGIVNSGRL